MAYVAGHDYAVRYVAEASPLFSGTALVALPSSPTLIGYTKPGGIVLNEGNGSVYAAGSNKRLAKKKGARTYQASVMLDPIGDLTFLSGCLDGTEYALPYGASGNYTNALRGAKCNSLSLSFAEGDGQALTGSASFEAIAHQWGISAYTIDEADFDAALAPYFWHNITSVTIGATQVRAVVQSIDIQYSRNLERKGVRPDIGDDVPISRTSYSLLPHLVNVSATIRFHEALAASYFNAADDTTTGMGDITITVANSAGTTVATFVIDDPVIQNYQQDETDVSAQMTNTLSVDAKDLTLTVA